MGSVEQWSLDVGFLDVSHVDLFEFLCEARGMPAGTFPSAERLGEMIEGCGEIAIGVFQSIPGQAESRLIGALIVYHLGQEATGALERGEWRDGKAIRPAHLARTVSASTSSYVSCIVTLPEASVQALRALAAWVERSGISTLFARPITADGRRTARGVGFQALVEDHPVWRLDRRPKIDAASSRARKKPRLGRYDRTAVRIAKFTRVANPAVALGYVATILATFCTVFLVFDQVFRADLFIYVSHLIPVVGAPVASVAATLGGLASTIFFLTAQLRVSGFRQYGITNVYRFRSYAPIIILTSLSVLLSMLAIVLNPLVDSSDIAVSSMLEILAFINFVFLIAFIFLLSLTFMANMDPISLARRFALQIQGSDATEWGLVSIRPRPNKHGYLIQINSNRTNFGLRDPLMAVHELIESANNQRYGQILSVLAERIALSYQLPWSMQFPDTELWELEYGRPIRRFDRLITRFTRASVNSPEHTMDRLHLVMLVLHYFRRLHRNRKIEVAPDARRQSAQFVLSRLIVVLARGVSSRHQRPPEIDDVLHASIDAILGICVDFETLPRLSTEKPYGQREGLRGLVSAAISLEIHGFHRPACHAADAIGYIRGLSPTPLSDERVPDIDRMLGPYDRLAKRAQARVGGRPPYSKYHAWSSLRVPID